MARASPVISPAAIPPVSAPSARTIRSVSALRQQCAQRLLTVGGTDEPRGERHGELIGIADAIAAGVDVLGEDLGERVARIARAAQPDRPDGRAGFGETLEDAQRRELRELEDREEGRDHDRTRHPAAVVAAQQRLELDDLFALVEGRARMQDLQEVRLALDASRALASRRITLSATSPMC